MKYFLIALLFNFSFLISCRFYENEEINIKINNGTNKTSLSLTDILIPNSFVTLKGISPLDLRSIEKVLFTRSGNILVLDNKYDFQNLYMFDRDGFFIKEVGAQGTGQFEHEFLADVGLFKDEITLLASGQRAFYNYSENDNQNPTVVANGATGNMFARDLKGNYFLYNEHSSTNETGMHYIIVYDKHGNLINRFFPYHESRENQGYGYTGFLNKSGDDIWFCPPFGNTVYKVSENGITSIFQFDFGEASVTEQMANKKVKGMELSSFGFLNESFIKHNNLIQFEYQFNNMVLHGFYDINSNKFLNNKSFQQDVLSSLYASGRIMPYNENSFNLVLAKEQTSYLFRMKKLDISGLNSLQPGLGNALEEAGKNEIPFLINFAYKNGVVLE